MLRSGLIATLALLLVPGSALAAGPATVTLSACTPKERTAEFEARMDQVSGAVRMKLRYTLEARKPGRLWRRVAAPELGGWRAAALETTRFISERRVTQLVGPSSYRALVRFRWIDEDGHVVARARARSRSCWQPDHRPNLKLRELSFEGEGAYVVLVANTGRSPTGAFDLADHRAGAVRRRRRAAAGQVDEQRAVAGLDQLRWHVRQEDRAVERLVRGWSEDDGRAAAADRSADV